VRANFSGYVLTLSDQRGRIRLGVKFTQLNSSSLISIDTYNDDTSAVTTFVKVDYFIKTPSWQQFAIGFTQKRIRVFYNCDKVHIAPIQGINFESLPGGLMLALGPYLETSEGKFSGEIEQLALTDNPDAGQQQCSMKYMEPVS